MKNRNKINNLKITTQYRRQFGIWVGLYNNLTQSKWSVQAALDNPTMRKMFEQTANGLTKKYQRASEMLVPTTTSRLSYEALAGDLDGLDDKVYKFIKKNPGLCRSEINRRLKMKIQTLSGCVTRLKHLGLVRVLEIGFDHETNRSVELLEAA